jgi:hypothetical protein
MVMRSSSQTIISALCPDREGKINSQKKAVEISVEILRMDRENLLTKPNLEHKMTSKYGENHTFPII